jgi:hypothetical protein
LFLDHQVEDKETIGTHNIGRKRVEGREASSKIIYFDRYGPLCGASASVMSLVLGMRAPNH